MRRATIIRQLREFFAFGAGLWGLVAAASFLLPVANAVTDIIPLEPKTVGLATALALIGAIFAFAYSFTEGTHIQELERRRPFFRGEMLDPRRAMLHNAAARFAWGLVVIMVYVVLNAFHGILQGNSDEVTKYIVAVVEPLATVSYAAAFALVTGAFSTLAALHYTRLPDSDIRMGTARLGLQMSSPTSAIAEEQNLTRASNGVGESEEQDQGTDYGRP